MKYILILNPKEIGFHVMTDETGIIETYLNKEDAEFEGELHLKNGMCWGYVVCEMIGK